MSDAFIHDLAREFAHAVHADDKESAYYKVTLTQKELPFLKDNESVVIEYRRREITSNRTTDAAGVYIVDEVVYAGV